MKKSTAGFVLGIVVIIAAGLYFRSTEKAAPVVAEPTPGTAAGLNGSPNQGNLGQPDTGTPQTPTTPPAGDGTSISDNLIMGVTVDPSIGQFLTAYNGMTLYAYDKDTKDTSNCTDACAANWPPYSVTATTRINVPGTVTGVVGKITRADGTLQITYNGMPVYFYKSDVKSGDIKGKNVGGVWHLVNP